MTDPFVRIKDSKVRDLAASAQMIRHDYESNDPNPWEDSPFGWIKEQSSRRVGAIGEKLVAAWCTSQGFDVLRSPDSEADRIIKGYRVEIKFSTLWQGRIYKFQQIRDQRYDYLFALGISPFDAHAWVLPKSILYEKVIGIMGQHTGADAADTAWLSVKVGKEYERMHPYGGSLSRARNFLAGLTPA